MRFTFELSPDVTTICEKDVMVRCDTKSRKTKQTSLSQSEEVSPTLRHRGTVE